MNGFEVSKYCKNGNNIFFVNNMICFETMPITEVSNLLTKQSKNNLEKTKRNILKTKITNRKLYCETVNNIKIKLRVYCEQENQRRKPAKRRRQ